MTATILTLPHYFPLVFVFRVIFSLLLFAVLVVFALLLYKHRKIDKMQKNAMTILSLYSVTMLYYTVVGRYSQSYYRYDFHLFKSYSSLVESFNMTDFWQFVINLVMMIPVSFLLMLIFNGRFRALLAFDTAVIFIFFIECLQFITRTGTFQVDDIFNNTIGVVIGIVLFYIVKYFYVHYKKRRNEKYE